MKNINYIKTALLSFTAMALLSSCLKDNRYIDFSTGGQQVAELTLSGLNNFGTDAITTDTATIGIGVNIASATVPNTDHKITIAIDTTLIASYEKTNPGITYFALPANTYTFTNQTVDLPSGTRTKIVTFTVYKNLLDPSKSYMLPITITSAPGLTIASNYQTHYYHVIGNDFAGVYSHHLYTRHSVPDTTGSYATSDAGKPVDLGPITFFPVSPSSFQVRSNYYTGIPYTVSFTKTGNGPTALYSNWTITFGAADLANYFGSAITVTTGPLFDVNPSYFSPAFDPKASYTYAQSLKIFRFYYVTKTRAVQDEYIK